MSATPEFNEAQLNAARSIAWRQSGDPLLTLEAARDWINERGLVLFAPRAQQLPAPAPSLVEATLGAANAAPSMADTDVARGLVARLVGEGLALPLNLLAVPGDNPDFVVSAQVFSYIFTMRGDKAWKQPPSTSGAVKVSPLGLRVFEVLTERGPMSAAELASELGREVTEAAILRSLSELWSQLRVLPLLQQGDGVTLWELTSRRFTKAIKAGANAGQPTALSALISLHLAQVFAATEEEIATFLSPLTARSRIREVLHALVGARQLETVVLEGRTLLHIPGTLPASAAGVEETTAEEAVATELPKKIGTGRIKSFSGEGKPAAEFRGKPAARGFSSGRASVGRANSGRSGAGPAKPSARFGARLDGKNDRERRPFKKEGSARPEKPNFTKPWNEDRKPRPAARPDGFTKFRKPAPEDREPLGPREQAGLPAERRSSPKPSFDRTSKSAAPAKRPYTPRSAEGGDRGSFKPRSFERAGAQRSGKPDGSAPKRPYTPRTTEAGERTFAKRPYTPRTDEGGERGPFKPRSFERGGERGGERRGARPGGKRESGTGGFGAKRPFTPRSNAISGSDAAERPAGTRPYTPRAGDSGAGFKKRPYTPRETPSHGTEDSGERTLPKRPYKPRAADAHARPFTKAPWVPPAEGGGAKRPYKPRAQGGFKSAGAGPRKSSRPSSSGNSNGKTGGKFGGRSAGSGAKRSGPSGGFKSTARKRPESEE